jgi:DNA-binding Lrp family transcriptional regulator
MMTINENKVLRKILMSFGEDYSINQIAKQCNIAPNGAFKILKKLEKQGILKIKKIANIVSYKINFENNKAENILELSLIPELEGRLKFRMEDLRSLKKITEACIVFGSYMDDKKQPNDLDIFFILKEKNFEEYKSVSKKIYQTMPIKVHEVLQTEEDLSENISKRDKIIIEIFGKGIIFWGYNEILELVKKEYIKWK